MNASQPSAKPKPTTSAAASGASSSNARTSPGGAMPATCAIGLVVGTVPIRSTRRVSRRRLTQA